MTYALIKNGRVAEYPYTVRQLRADNPKISFPEAMPDAALAAWGVFPVETLPRPTVGAAQYAVERAPEMVGGSWQIGWDVLRHSDEKIIQIIKRQAERRILATVPEWKQRNLAIKGQANWTPDEQAIWSEVERLRARSGEIEQMDPLKIDIADDALWAAPT